MNDTRSGIGLVLGGGGSRGIAHAGVLEVLVREQIPIDLIVGTSMGAIVGSLFALGLSPKQIIAEMSNWRGNSIFTVNLFSSRARQRMIDDQLSAHLGGKTFADLKIPMIVMAVDMLTGREVALQSGPLLPAVLASSAVPGVFPPVEMDGMQLADGGVIDSLCTGVAFDWGVAHVIAVDIYPQLEQDDWSDPLSAIMGVDLPFNILGSTASPSMVSAIWRSVRIMMWHLHAKRLSLHPPDVLLRPDVGAYSSLDFKDIDGPLVAGRTEAENYLPLIRDLAGYDRNAHV
ncbi:MAG: patatin-like phospholipase family protein [Anaerolineae bacterium]|nr:patatin-like phospholipase family protein [Anaerolineae bacterium]